MAQRMLKFVGVAFALQHGWQAPWAQNHAFMPASDCEGLWCGVLCILHDSQAQRAWVA
jgi:hypothetical protein